MIALYVSAFVLLMLMSNDIFCLVGNSNSFKKLIVYNRSKNEIFVSALNKCDVLYIRVTRNLKPKAGRLTWLDSHSNCLFYSLTMCTTKSSLSLSCKLDVTRVLAGSMTLDDPCKAYGAVFGSKPACCFP